MNFLPGSCSRTPRNRTRAYEITVRVLGLTVRVKSLLLSAALAVSLAFFLAWFHGDDMIRMIDKYYRLVERIVVVTEAPQKSKPTPHKDARANTRQAQPSRPRALGANSSTNGNTIRSITGKASPELYRPAVDKLSGRVLPLRAAPNPYSAMLLAIPPDAQGIRATGSTATHHEWNWLFPRAVLWRQVIFQGVTGWVCDHFIELR